VDTLVPECPASKLNIPREVHHFFRDAFTICKNGDMIFSYDDAIEEFNLKYHTIPVSNHFWSAGNSNWKWVSHVFICSSAMEAIAWYTFHYGSFNIKEKLLFISFGNCPRLEKIQSISLLIKEKKIALITGNDLLGHLADLKIASVLRNKRIDITYLEPELIKVDFRSKEFIFQENRISLSALEKASGFRSDIRTHKPRQHSSYLQQLMF
jgi:hypothetical protein